MNQASTSLNIFARLEVSIAGQEVLVQADDSEVISVELPSLRVGWALFKLRPARRQRGKMLELIQSGLAASDLRLEFRVAGRTIGGLGTGGPPGIAATILGLRPLQLRPWEMLKALTSRPASRRPIA